MNQADNPHLRPPSSSSHLPRLIPHRIQKMATHRPKPKAPRAIHDYIHVPLRYLSLRIAVIFFSSCFSCGGNKKEEEEEED